MLTQLLFALAFLSALASADFPIKYWVVLMEENRSFDHLLGHLKKVNPEIEGLDGTEFNRYDPNDPNSPKVYATFDAPPVDPNADHSVPGTTEQIFGGPENLNLNPPPMNGFVASGEKKEKGWGKLVMQTFNSTTLPVLSTLATEFLLIDHWFSSIPGPTEVNRAYLHSATSNGYATNDVAELGLGFPQDCIQPVLSNAGYDWGVYYELFPAALFMRQLREYPFNFHSLEHFGTLAAEGNLPTYSFIEPRYYSLTSAFPANDQHPDHNIEDGEALIKWIYETVRASPLWNETAFIVVYDEHGGLYDHYPTPLHVPNPDGKNSTNPPFNFTRIGVRVPAVIASPWVNKGRVVHRPNGPHPDSEFEHSSLIATLNKVLGLNRVLTERDGWAGTFDEFFLERTTPRTDCPTKLPNPPQPKNLKNSWDLPMNDLQRNILSAAANMHGVDHEEILADLKTEREGGLFVEEVMNQWLAKAKLNLNKK